MAGELHVAPRPAEWLPAPGTAAAISDAWRVVLGAVEHLVDCVSEHTPGSDGCTSCAGSLPCAAHDEAVGRVLAALDDLSPRFERLDAAAVTDVVPGSPFVQLTDQVLVDPREVGAVTQDPYCPGRTRVWIRADHPSAIQVDRPLAEVAALLADAHCIPPPV